MNNLNPEIKDNFQKRIKLNFKDNFLTDITEESIFELIRDIKDPEHPHTLEELGVVNIEDIEIGEYLENPNVLCTLGYPIKYIKIFFTPTVPHCSLAGVIGLTIKYLVSKFTKGFWIQIFIKEGSHSNDKMYNKQFGDNDRVMAAFENEALLDVINECIPEQYK